MKERMDLLRGKPPVVYLLTFLGMVIPSLLAYHTAEVASQPGIRLCLGLVILANLVAVFPQKTK